MSRYEKLLMVLFLGLFPSYIIGTLSFISIIRHDYPYREINIVLFVIFFIVALVARKVLK